MQLTSNVCVPSGKTRGSKGVVNGQAEPHPQFHLQSSHISLSPLLQVETVRQTQRPGQRMMALLALYIHKMPHPFLRFLSFIYSVYFMYVSMQTGKKCILSHWNSIHL